MKSILVTGGAGFIGSNFVSYLLKTYPNYHIVNLDKLTYAGSMENLLEDINNSRHTFIHGDICSQDLLEKLFKTYDIQGVIHFAAESHVDNSIHDPGVFMQTNVLGTYTLLETARNRWMKAPYQYKEGYEKCRFHHISTDEVYGTLNEDSEPFTENSPYAPNSPYSASKASSDMIVKSYYHTFGLNTVISNCSNNYGPKQHSEKLIPTIIQNALLHRPIPIYGNGQNVRDWIYVMDHCRGIDAVFHRGEPGQSYNIGANNEQRNLNIAHTICDILDRMIPQRNHVSYRNLINFVPDRPGHDYRYALNTRKINELGWFPEENFESGLSATVKWYLSKE